MNARLVFLAILLLLLPCVFGAPVMFRREVGTHDSIRVPIFAPTATPSAASTPPALPSALSAMPPTEASVIDILPEPSAEPSPYLETPEPEPAMAPPIENEDRACLPSHAIVELVGGRSVTMASIRVGDVVRVGLNRYSPVLAITHEDASASTAMVRVRTAHATLLVSRGHLLKSNGRLISASKLRIGDGLSVLVSGRVVIEPILDAGLEITRGLFNPQTASGTFLASIDGTAPVLISSYTTAVHPAIAHSLLAPLRALYLSTGSTVPALSKIFTAIHVASTSSEGTATATAQDCSEVQSHLYQVFSMMMTAALPYISGSRLI